MLQHVYFESSRSYEDLIILLVFFPFVQTGILLQILSHLVEYHDNTRTSSYMPYQSLRPKSTLPRYCFWKENEVPIYEQVSNSHLSKSLVAVLLRNQRNITEALGYRRSSVGPYYQQEDSEKCFQKPPKTRAARMALRTALYSETFTAFHS